MALSASRNVDIRNDGAARIEERLIKTGVVIYKGAIVYTDSAGEALVTANGAQKVLGIALEQYAAGDAVLTCKCITNVHALLPVAATVEIDDEGKTALHGVDDETVSDVTTVGPQIGMLVQYVADAGSWVGVGMPTMAADSG